MANFVNPFRYSAIRPDFLNGTVSVELADGNGFNAVPDGTADFHQFTSEDALQWVHGHNARAWRDLTSRSGEASGTAPKFANADDAEPVADESYEEALHDNSSWQLRGLKLADAYRWEQRGKKRVLVPDAGKKTVLSTRLFNEKADAFLRAELADAKATADAQARNADLHGEIDATRRLGALEVAQGDVHIQYGIYDREEDGVVQDEISVLAPFSSLAEFVGMAESADPETICRILVAAAQKIRDEMFPPRLRVMGDARFSDSVTLGGARMVPVSDLPEIDEEDSSTYDDHDGYPGFLAQGAIFSVSSKSGVPSQKMIRVNLEVGENGRQNVRVIVERPKLDAYGPTLALRGQFRAWVDSRLRGDAVTVAPQPSLEDLFG